MTGVHPLLARLLTTVLLVALGVVAGVVVGPASAADSTPFFVAASALLAVGLFAASSSIPWSHLRDDRKLVLAAVTGGVLLKAALISALLYAVFRQPSAVVLGPAMAQIDPLSVAALQKGSRLSQRGRALLAAWAAFDDPVTTVLVVALVPVAVLLSAPGSVGVGASIVSGVGSTALGTVALVAAAGLAWAVLRWLRERAAHLPTRAGASAPPPRWWIVASVVVILVVLGLAVWWFLMLAVAVAGLFLRPGIDRLLDHAAAAALMVATVLLGFAIADGVTASRLLQGVVLGVAAYVAQVVAGLLVARRLPDDRLRLALGQQSGITAILLAIVLESILPGTVTVVAPAILVVNVLHWTLNAAVDAAQDRRGRGHDTSPSDTVPRDTAPSDDPFRFPDDARPVIGPGGHPLRRGAARRSAPDRRAPGRRSR